MSKTSRQKITDDDCFIDFSLRKKQRLSYPGACSLEYQSAMQIVIQCLIGWDLKTKQGRKGIFGVPVAFGSADEEQGRKTVHGYLD